MLMRIGRETDETRVVAKQDAQFGKAPLELVRGPLALRAHKPNPWTVLQASVNITAPHSTSTHCRWHAPNVATIYVDGDTSVSSTL
jgi:hypothetical protein